MREVHSIEADQRPTKLQHRIDIHKLQTRKPIKKLCLIEKLCMGKDIELRKKNTFCKD